MGEIDALRVAQQDKCAICGIHAADIKHKAFDTNPLVIDHSHTSGKVRGLLCPKCNVGLGHFDDDPEALRKAREYLLARADDDMV